jgi:hypothetical protein
MEHGSVGSFWWYEMDMDSLGGLANDDISDIITLQLRDPTMMKAQALLPSIQLHIIRSDPT